jgi:hypothetical protein
MEDLLKFCNSLELSRDTLKIILDIVRSIQSLFPFNPVQPVFASRTNSADFIAQAFEILKIARDKQDIFEGIFNPEDLEKYLKVASDFGEILGQVEKLQNSLRNYQTLPVISFTRLR